MRLRRTAHSVTATLGAQDAIAPNLLHAFYNHNTCTTCNVSIFFTGLQLFE
jgi:hypothetical protein